MTAKTSFRGSFTALVTPFKNGSVDEKAFRELVDWQIAEGTNGLVPVGTTGESPTLSHQEHEQVVQWCVDQAKGRVPVIAGAGSNSTAEAISLAKHAEKAGAAAVLGIPGGVPEGRLRCRVETAGQACAPAHQPVRRDQPGAGEIRAVAARQVLKRAAAADGAGLREGPGRGARGHGARGADQL